MKNNILIRWLCRLLFVILIIPSLFIDTILAIINPKRYNIYRTTSLNNKVEKLWI